MKLNIYTLIPLLINFILSLNYSKGGESVTSTNCLTEKQDHSDITEVTNIHSTVANTALSLIQIDTTPDNGKIKQSSANTSTKSATTDIYLDAAQRNYMSSEGTAFPTPIDPCLMKGNCNFTAPMKHQFCHCDPDCYMYSDCCIDSKELATTSVSPYSPYFKCHKGHTTDGYEGYFAVDSCPNDYENKTDTRLCNEHKFSETGPSVVNPEGIVFKNRHCALCHGISDVESFEVMFFMQEKALKNLLSIINNLTKNEKIDHMVQHFEFKEIPPKQFVPRPCILHTIEQDNPLCYIYINPVYIFKRVPYIYRNYFCTPVRIRHLIECLGKTYDRLARERITMYSISVMLFSFNKATQNARKDICDHWTKEVEETNACPENETYTNFRIEMQYIKLTSNETLTSVEAFIIIKTFAMSLEISNLTELIGPIHHLRHKNTSIIIISGITIEFQPTMFAQEIKQLHERFQRMKWKMRLKDDSAYHHSIEVRRELLEVNGGGNIYQIFENETGVKLKIGHLQKIDNYHDLDLPRLENMCDDIIINGIRYNASVIDVTSIGCNNGVERTVNGDNSLIRGIITYICFSVSIVSLLLLIVIYRKIGMSSTIPGSNLENISISLIMSNCLFMFGVGASDIREVCFVIGVVLHHLWLSVFYFISMATLTIVINLTKQRSTEKKSQNNLNGKKRMYILGGVIVPCLFVGPAVFLDIYGDAYLDSGYGTKPCFPHIFPANLIFFSGPVMLSITINFAFLLRVTCHICRLSHEIGNISLSTPFTHAKVCLRILVLSGFFWITGILAAMLDSEWIDYMFTLLCGLQGFFISVASLTTRQVIRKLKRQESTAQLHDRN